MGQGHPHIYGACFGMENGLRTFDKLPSATWGLCYGTFGASSLHLPPAFLRRGFNPLEHTLRLRGLDLVCGSGNVGRGLEDGGAVEMRWSNDIWDRATHTYMAPVSAWRTACEHSIKQCTAAWGLGYGTFGGLGPLLRHLRGLLVTPSASLSSPRLQSP
jgi:hypothetical protein